MKKSYFLLTIMITLFVLKNATIIYSEESAEKLIGTWVKIWHHSESNIKGKDGKETIKTMFTPDFHAEAGERKSESYIRFKEDGTGTYFSRNVINKDGSIVVIKRDYDKKTKKWVDSEKDELQTRMDFKWSIQDNKLIMELVQRERFYFNSGVYEIEFNSTPTRPMPAADEALLKEYGVKDEVIIYLIGQFLKMTNESVITDFSKRYNIP